MLGMIGKHLTFANVCSVLALTVALGTGTAYAANTVFSRDIVNGEVKTADLADSAVKSAKVADGSVTSADLADAGITAFDLATDSVTATQLRANAAGQSEIAHDGVGADELADSSVDTGELVDDSILAVDVAPSTLTGSEVANSSLTGDDIAQGSIQGGDIANGTITSADILGADEELLLDVAGLGLARCDQLAIPIAGAAADQTVLVSTEAAVPEGLVVHGVRAADAEVTVEVCNLTGKETAQVVDLPIRVMTFG